MPSSKKLITLPIHEIEPDLLAFLDEVLVPMLVRDAVREISDEIRLAPALSVVAQSPRRQEGQ
jgi:hypothetical protein